MRAIICLAGGIASGKTTVAQTLADTWPNSSVRSFGDLVRRRARADGLPLDRATLQETGLRLIAEGWPGFVDELLADVPPDADMLIVDGVRHVEAAEELRRRFPDVPVRLVFLKADAKTLQRRFEERDESDDVLDHRVESSLESVADVADLEIVTSLPSYNIAAKIRSLLG
jgi:cytidylate kinase